MPKPYAPGPIRPELGRAIPAPPAKTVPSAIAARDELARRISVLLLEFEQRTGCSVDSIQLQAQRGADHQGRPRQGKKVIIAARLGDLNVKEPDASNPIDALFGNLAKGV